jgi:4-amino-4-deoxy-L-arabinose transferase-like glycosyltransferase
MTDPLKTSQPTTPGFVPTRALFGLGVTFALLGLITGARLVALVFYGLDLHPDEAQYWSWSRDLTWGYFSKPPMIAWLIATSTTVCGAGEGCVKASIPILHFVTALLVYGIGRRLYDRAIGFFAALTFMTLPGISFSATVASTDPPLLTFWALALYALVRLIQNAAHPYLWWVVLGVGIGFGLLSKYAMAFFILGLVLWLVLDSDARARLRIPGPGILGLAMALALGGMIYLPNLIWNIESGFVTFVHTGANANLKGSLFHPAELGAFLASQFGVFGPVLFAALLWFGIQIKKWRLDDRSRFLAAFVLPMLLTITTLALTSRANANWAAPVYVAGSVWVTAALMAGARGGLKRGLMRGLMLGSLGLHSVVAALLVVGIAFHGITGKLHIPAVINPYHHYDGWRELGVRISTLRAHYPGVPLLIDDRKLTAALLYYVRPRPSDVFAWHAGGKINDHFKLTRPLPNTQPNRPGGDFLLVTRYGDVDHLRSRFAKSAVIATLSGPAGDPPTRKVRVIHLKGFMGYNQPGP